MHTLGRYTSGVLYLLRIQQPEVNYSAHTSVTTPQDIDQMMYFKAFGIISSASHPTPSLLIPKRLAFAAYVVCLFVTTAHFLCYVLLCCFYLSLLYHDMQLHSFVSFCFWTGQISTIQINLIIWTACLWLCEMTVHCVTAFVKCPWAWERRYIN